MSDRLFRLLFGAVLLVALYFKAENVVFTLVGLLVFEATTNRQALKFFGRIYRNEFGPKDMPIRTPTPKFKLEAEQGLRMIMACVLIVGILLPEATWFFPWIVGIALVGAGLSGICPVVLMLKWARLK